MLAPEKIAKSLSILEYRVMKGLQFAIPTVSKVAEYLKMCTGNDVDKTFKALVRKKLIAESQQVPSTFYITDLGRQVVREASTLLGIDRL